MFLARYRLLTNTRTCHCAVSSFPTKGEKRRCFPPLVIGWPAVARIVAARTFAAHLLSEDIFKLKMPGILFSLTLSVVSFHVHFHILKQYCKWQWVKHRRIHLFYFWNIFTVAALHCGWNVKVWPLLWQQAAFCGASGRGAFGFFIPAIMDAIAASQRRGSRRHAAPSRYNFLLINCKRECKNYRTRQSLSLPTKVLDLILNTAARR